MLEYIIDLLPQTSFTKLFGYLTFKAMLACLLSFFIIVIFGKSWILRLHKWQKEGQPIREDGPKTHLAKKGTATMGGLIIIAVGFIVSLILADFTNKFYQIAIFVMLSYALLGFIDDYLKVFKKNTQGVIGRVKLVFQLFICIVALYLINNEQLAGFNSKVMVPYLKQYFVELGVLYLPFAAIVLIGSSNAVNLTDGLDGLVTVPLIIAFGSFAAICYVTCHHEFALYLNLLHIKKLSEVFILLTSMIGACLGFLWFNAKPAQIFMGDTGSLSLGGLLGVTAILSKQELLLAIIGIVFVAEALSVIIQVYYFKITGGKRIFKMAPLHHHFEQQGMAESKVVIRFWIAALIAAIIGMSSLKIR